MNAFLIYCAVCWVLAAANMFWLVDDSELEEDLMDVGLPAQDHRKAILLFVLGGPLWVPYALAAGLICVIKELWKTLKLKRSRKSFSEYRLTEINYFDQSPEARAAFDEATVVTWDLDFRLIGDYQVKAEPITVLGRYFWSGDDTTWCVCCWIPDFHNAGDLNIEIKTLLSDGTEVATVTVDDVHPETSLSVADDHLHVSHVPLLSIEEAYGLHVQEVHRIATEQGAEILQFDKEQLESLVIYNQRLYHLWLHQIGESGRPPEPELPAAKGRLTPDEYLLTVAASDFADANNRPEELAV